MDKEIIILTKSDKNGGYCVAGIDVASGEFIRLVSEDVKSEHALFSNDLLYDDEKSHVETMDVVRVTLKGKQDCWYQPENYILDNNSYIKKIRKANTSEIKNFLTHRDDIFYNNCSSIETEELKTKSEKYSLIVFTVKELAIWKDKYKDGRITASFTYNGQQYKYIKITDHVLTHKYYQLAELCYPQPYTLNNAIIIMSLAGSFVDGKHYKLVANIIED